MGVRHVGGGLGASEGYPIVPSDIHATHEVRSVVCWVVFFTFFSYERAIHMCFGFSQL